MKRAYACACGQPVFFRNSQCVNCQRPLGYNPESNLVEALVQESDETFRLASDESGRARLWWRCANLVTPAACNWMVPAMTFENAGRLRLCAACGLNRTVPDWSNEINARNWRSMELAKRRVISQILGLGLPVRSRFTDDPVHGLAFDLLAPLPGGPAVLTGHQGGVITVNLEEADDVNREVIRAQLHEPYRTLVGHLRHEIGHYYWDRLVADGPWHEAYRQLFGDETVDYTGALQRHYDNGADPSWPDRYISSYASSHPWEDWAESWAHYMHMCDGIDTAASLGLDIPDAVIEPIDDVLPAPASGEQADPGDFSRLHDTWLKLVQVLNQMSRSMGERDFYPFIVSAAAREKLEFVHRVIADQRASAEPAAL